MDFATPARGDALRERARPEERAPPIGATEKAEAEAAAVAA